MPISLRLASVGLAVALVAAGAPAAHAAAKPSIKVSGGQTQPVFSYSDAVRQFVRVESPVDSDGDGRKDLIRVDIIRPKESGPRFKVPAIIDESPYYDNLGRGNESEKKTYDANGNPAKFPLFYDNYFVPRGYAVLEVDMDGTTKSDGCPTSGGASDVLGGKAVIDWLNGRARAYDAQGKEVTASWHNGRSAMIGKSYDGTLANAVAATGVRGLETIVPISAIDSWYDYSRMNGVKYFNDEEPGLADTVDTDPPAKCAAVNQKLDAGEDDATGNYNAFWDERNYLTGTVAQARRVHASVFAVHGVNDLNVKPNHFSTWWSALSQRGVPRKLWLSQYGHTDPFDFRRDVWVNTLNKWFDYWLWHVGNDVMRQPRVDLETGPDQWTTQRDWPAATHMVSLRPQADGTLGLRPGSGGGTYTETKMLEADLAADPTTGRSYRLAYVTPALKRGVRLSGTPTVHLRVKLDRPTANLGALLVDYGTDTRVNYLDEKGGVKNVSGEDCYGQSTATDDACYIKTATDTVTADVNVVARGWLDAQNRTSLTTPSPLTPGSYYDVAWRTLPQDYQFKPGHRVGLILTGLDADVNYDETATGAQVTVDLAGSRIDLPVTSSPPGAADFRARDNWRGPSRVTLRRHPQRFF